MTRNIITLGEICAEPTMRNGNMLLPCRFRSMTGNMESYDLQREALKWVSRLVEIKMKRPKEAQEIKKGYGISFEREAVGISERVYISIADPMRTREIAISEYAKNVGVTAYAK